MDINCPHCGTEYEVEKQEMYRYTTCEVCGKGFVIGATTSLLSSEEKPMPAVRQSASMVSSSPTPSSSSVPRSRPFAGKIGNGAAHPSVPSAKFNWSNPFVWASIACACLVVVVVIALAVTSKNTHNRKAKKGVNLAQVEKVENTGATTAPCEAKEDAVSPEAETTMAAESIQGASPQVSEPVQRIKNEPAETEGDDANEDEPVATSDNDVKIEKNIIQAKNPLELFKFGDARNPQTEVNQDGTIRYTIKGFLGIQQMILGYTKKNSLYSICFVSENDHYSAAESDVRVSKLMQLCDEWYDGIEWEMGAQGHDGRKFAIGRIKSEGNGKVNFQDILFSIVPTRGERNIVGLQVNLIDNRRRRLDNSNVDARHLFSVSPDECQEAQRWLKEQFRSNSLSEFQFDRHYDKKLRMYRYNLDLDWGSGKLIGSNYYIKQLYISLYNGVLKTDCRIGIERLPNPISDEYAEEIIMAKIKTFNNEMEGIAGDISDNRGTGASIRLPCPACHGESMSTPCQECWDKNLKRNSGLLSLSKSEFRYKFNDYKQYYKTQIAPHRWHDKPKRNKPK